MIDYGRAAIQRNINVTTTEAKDLMEDVWMQP